MIPSGSTTLYGKFLWMVGSEVDIQLCIEGVYFGPLSTGSAFGNVTFAVRSQHCIINVKD